MSMSLTLAVYLPHRLNRLPILKSHRWPGMNLIAHMTVSKMVGFSTAVMDVSSMWGILEMSLTQRPVNASPTCLPLPTRERCSKLIGRTVCQSSPLLEAGWATQATGAVSHPLQQLVLRHPLFQQARSGQLSWRSSRSIHQFQRLRACLDSKNETVKFYLLTPGSVIFRPVLEIQRQVDHRWPVRRPTSARCASATRRGV